MDRKKLMLLLGALVIAIGTALAARSLLAGGSAPKAEAAQVPQGPKVLVAQRARYVDLDGPLLLARDRAPGLTFDGSTIRTPPRGLWG